MKHTVRMGIMVAIILLMVSTGADASQTQVTVINQSDRVKVVDASVMIDAPPETVWQVLTNYGNIKNILPGYNRSEVIQAGRESSTVNLGLKISNLLPAYRYQVRIRENSAANSIQIQRVSGDFKAFKATYRLVAAANGTRTQLFYNLYIDLGPDGTAMGAGHILKTNTNQGMESVRKVCNQAFRRSLTAQR